MKFEYCEFVWTDAPHNYSALADFGKQGWEVVCQLQSGNLLMKRA